MFLEYSTNTNSNIVAQDVTKYYIKCWIVNDDNASSDIYVRTFCGLIENWGSTKFNHKCDTLIYDKEVSCSINIYRAAIKPILCQLASNVEYRKFQIRRSDINILVESIDRNIMKNSNIGMESLKDGLEDIKAVLE